MRYKICLPVYPKTASDYNSIMSISEKIAAQSAALSGLILIFLLAVFLRWHFSKEYRFLFFYDQARDAYVSRQIIENKDLKLQGPSASGTNDSVYHGVLYYYLIGPLYTLSHGDPQAPVLALAVLSATGVFPLYWLMLSISKRRNMSLLFAGLYATSSSSIFSGIWLSNPALAMLILGWFYLSLWKCFYEKKASWLIMVAISLAAAIQSALWLVYLVAPLVFSFLYLLKNDKSAARLLLKPRIIVPSAVLFAVLTSSMVVTEFLMWRRGILSLSAIEGTSIINSNPTSLLSDILMLFLNKLLTSIYPTSPILSVFVLIYLYIKRHSVKSIGATFFTLIIVSPLFLFAIQPRMLDQYLIFIEVGIYGIVLLAFATFRQGFQKSIVLAVLLLLYASSQWQASQLYVNHPEHYFPRAVHRGVLLNNQLELIEYTYSVANGQPFSISVFGNPLGYYITWAYLYDWYGVQQFGYKPNYVGPSQQGLVGENLLNYSTEPSQIHFAIIEPDISSNPLFLNNFNAEQAEKSEVLVDSVEFGKMQLEQRTSTRSAVLNQ